MKYFALEYDTVDDFATRRAPFRQVHLRLVREAHARGDIPMAGALGDPPEGALLIFRATTAEVAERFAREDPYVTSGVVTRWRVRPWKVMVGGEGES